MYFVRLRAFAEIAPISTWALFGAGIALSLMLAAMVLVLWLGGWTRASDPQRIWYLGAIALGLALDLAVVIASLAQARLAAHGPGGMSFDISSMPQPSVVKTTTTTEVKKNDAA